MLKEKDFETYQLESLLAQPKYKIDTTDPEHDDVVSASLRALISLKQFSIIKRFEDKYIMHGMSDNLLESFAPSFESVGLRISMVKEMPIADLKQSALEKATRDVQDFTAYVEKSPYLIDLTSRLRDVEETVLAMFPDEVTTYEHVDAVAFAKTKVRGFSYENFSTKLKGVQILLGALNTYPRQNYVDKPLRNSMQWHLLQAGFSFDGPMIIAPKDDDTVVTDTLESLGWTPAKVNEMNFILDSVIGLERTVSVLPNVVPDMKAIESTKTTALLVENCYNVRNIMSYIKNTLYTMCNQYLSMVRSYQ